MLRFGTYQPLFLLPLEGRHLHGIALLESEQPVLLQNPVSALFGTPGYVQFCGAVRFFQLPFLPGGLILCDKLVFERIADQFQPGLV